MTAAPFSSQIWPPVEPRTLTRQVWNVDTARTIPGLGRALGIYGMVSQCTLQHFRGDEQLVGALPRMLQQPDPDMVLPTWITVHVEDYLLHGNAAHLVTAWGADGMPAAGRWYPAHAWNIQPDSQNQPVYSLYGREVPRDAVVHVQRGADPAFPFRGVGVVEQYLSTFNRAGLQGAAESAMLTDRGMPAVAVITPNVEPMPTEEADALADKWIERFAGASPKPGIFPKDTQVIPLSWNPNDQQMTQARSLTVKDIANACNLDGYWLGAEGSSHTYRTPGPMFLSLLRTSIEPLLAPIEAVWSQSWLPYGRRLRLDRVQLLRDDLQTMMTTFEAGSRAGLFPDPDEPRRYMGFPPLTDEQRAMKPPTPAPAPTGPPTPDPTPDDPTEDPED